MQVLVEVARALRPGGCLLRLREPEPEPEPAEDLSSRSERSKVLWLWFEIYDRDRAQAVRLAQNCRPEFRIGRRQVREDLQGHLNRLLRES